MVTKAPGKERPTESVCLFCGKTFPVRLIRGPAPKYCSENCCNKASAARRKAEQSEGVGIQLTCAYCGKTFWWSPSTRIHSKERPIYCSHSCTVMAHRARYKERYAAYQHALYMAHKPPPKPRKKMSDEERKRRSREYFKAWRARKKQQKEQEENDRKETAPEKHDLPAEI